MKKRTISRVALAIVIGGLCACATSKNQAVSVAPFRSLATVGESIPRQVVTRQSVLAQVTHSGAGGGYTVGSEDEGSFLSSSFDSYGGERAGNRERGALSVSTWRSDNGPEAFVLVLNDKENTDAGGKAVFSDGDVLAMNAFSNRAMLGGHRIHWESEYSEFKAEHESKDLLLLVASKKVNNRHWARFEVYRIQDKKVFRDIYSFSTSTPLSHAETNGFIGTLKQAYSR